MAKKLLMLSMNQKSREDSLKSTKLSPNKLFFLTNPFKIVFLEGWQSLVECTGLENRQVRNGFVGSNPTPSAKKTFLILFINQKIFFYKNLV